MRVRLALAVTLLLVVGALVLDMSGSAARIAGTDHTIPAGFVAQARGGQEVCQPQMVLPSDAQRLRVLIGTYGSSTPEMTVRFLGVDGRQVARGRLPAGATEGYVSIPISYPHGPSLAGTLCIRMGGVAKVTLAGDTFTPGPASEQIDGVPQAGRIDVEYVRPGRETWWQLLPALSRRFGLGKASVFGTWALPVAALVLLAVWVGTIRLLARELP